MFNLIHTYFSNDYILYLTRSLQMTRNGIILHSWHMLKDANWRDVPCYLMHCNLVSVMINLFVFR